MTTLKIDRAWMHQLREGRGWSEKQLARNAGVELQTIQRAERSEPLDAPTIARIAQALGVSALDLIEKPDPSKAELLFLPRLTIGGTLDDLVRTDFRSPWHDEPADGAGCQAIQAFFDSLEYVWISWHDDLDPTERLEERATVQRAVEDVEAAGFWVFCFVRTQDRIDASSGGAVQESGAYIVVARPDHPNVLTPAGSPGSAGIFKTWPLFRR